MGRVRTPEDVGETLVVQRGDEAILVRHLGDVRLGAALRRGEGSYGGRPAVIVGIQKQPGTNTLELTERIDRELDELSRTLPAGLTLERDVFRQADFIEVAVENVLAALRDGVALVLLIVLLFLASGRASAITIVAIPLSLVTAVFALSAFGATLNTMTLGGMAIAVGELVDDAVIDVENVVRRLRLNALLPEAERLPALQVVLSASREIRSSIVFATAVVVLVFLPLFFLSGVEGRLLAPLGIAYVVSLTASLFVAVTVTPVLCSFLLPGSKAVTSAHEPRFARGSSGATRRCSTARCGVGGSWRPWRSRCSRSPVSRSRSRGARSSPSSAKGRWWWPPSPCRARRSPSRTRWGVASRRSS